MAEVRGNVRFMLLVIVLIISLAAAGVFMVFPVSKADVAIEPNRVEDIWPGETFTIDITIKGAEDIQAWEANVTFDPTILEVVDVAEGEFLKRKGFPTDFKYNIRLPPDGSPRILLSASYLMIGDPGLGVTGDGVLANITFRVKAEAGNTLIHLEEGYTTLIYNNVTAPALQPRDLHDGFFTNLHDIAVTGVAVSPTQVNPGDQVSINVTVVNEGDFNETFDVTTFQSLFPFPDLTEIGAKTGEKLEAGKTKTLEFTWDTTIERSGIYNITAEVPPVPNEVDTDDNNLTATDTVTFPGAPVAYFTHTERPIIMKTVTFNASLSYDPDDPVAGIVSYEWDLGDGTFDSGMIVTHNYTSIGNYDVNVTVTDIDSSRDSYTKTLTVSVAQPPIANFTCTTEEPLINRPVAFDASESYDPDGYIASYEWDFGDGSDLEFYNAPEGVIVTHKYTDARTYTVNLTVTDDHDASNSSTRDVTVLTKRDIAVVSVTCYRPHVMTKALDQAYVGEMLNISVVVRNEGTHHETFNLTVHYDDTFIGTLPLKVDLPPWDQAPHNQKSIGIFWDTTPVSAGNYTITVEAVLDGDENTANNNKTTKMKMDIPPDVAITNVTVSPTTVLAGDGLNITVFIKNEGTHPEDCTVKVYFSNDTHSEICPPGSTTLTQKALSVEPDEEKAVYFNNWNLTESQLYAVNPQVNMTPMYPGTYTLSAKALEVSKYEFDTDDNLYIYGNVTIGTSLISIFAPENTVTVGSTTTINGSITPTRHHANVTIWYRLSEEETWDILETLTTDENSTYIYDWTPENTGTYYLKASWLGDNMTLPDESDILEISVQEASRVLYIVAGVAIIVAAAVVIYFLKVRKVRKPTK